MDRETKIKVFSTVMTLVLVVAVIVKIMSGFSDNTVFDDKNNESNDEANEEIVYNEDVDMTKSDDTSDKTFYNPKESSSNDDLDTGSESSTLDNDAKESSQYNLGELDYTLEEMIVYLSDINFLYDEFTFNNDVIHDEEWSMYFNSTIDSMSDCMDRIRDLNTPAEESGKHSLAIEGVDELQNVVDNMKSALDNMNFAQIEDCAYSLEFGGYHISDALLVN
ncbi:hypothetical protein [Pseudogracilibacillus sp. SO10305]|uniref:hypothetical protein n=1 Tax=Pseudogracilibacillus sp. SO10305 TaxID=3098292 RepID=UPI00300E5B46